MDDVTFSKRKHSDISAPAVAQRSEQPPLALNLSCPLAVARGKRPRFWLQSRPPPAPALTRTPKTFRLRAPPRARGMKASVTSADHDFAYGFRKSSLSSGPCQARRGAERTKLRWRVQKGDASECRSMKLRQEVVLLQSDLLRTLARESYSIARRQRTVASYDRLYDRYTAVIDLTQPAPSCRLSGASGSDAGSRAKHAKLSSESSSSSASSALAISNGGSPPG